MKSNRGFTIVELMIGIGIIAVLLALAAPSFDKQVRRSYVSKVQEDLYADLIQARSEAISRSRPITVCPLADPNAVTPSCSGTGSAWNNGWLLFTDSDSDGVIDAANGNVPADELVKFYANTNRNRMSLSFNATGAKLKYDRRGTLFSGNGTFTICENQIGFAQALIISPGTGRARYSDKDADDGDLVCS